jgi:hypothetical protein
MWGVALTIAIVVILERNGDPKLVYQDLPNIHNEPSKNFQYTSDYEKREPIPNLAGRRERRNDRRN